MIQNPIKGGSPLFYSLAFATILGIYIIGAFLDVMDIDASQYASISRDMMLSGNYLQVYEREQDYLDKPPLLFWMTTLSFSIFGVSNVAYRIFPILYTLIGLYATYGLGKLYYNKQVGLLAALTLASSQAFFLIHHDVRTDTMLADTIIFAIWQIALFNEKKRMIHVVLGFVGIGLAMLAKGPIGLMVPVLALGTDFILKRKWLAFFRWQWLVGLGVVALILLPMCIGLYQQFDMHPEKVVNGKTGNSGLYFYFWKQSFGRLTGENDFVQGTKIIDKDYFFFVHNFIWSYLPWALLFFIVLWRDIAKVFKQRFKLANHQEALTLGGVVLPFLAMSLSQFKLPHYIYVFFPLVGIMIGKLLYDLIYENPSKFLYRLSAGCLILTVVSLWLLAGVLTLWAFPMKQVIIWVILGLFFLTTLHFIFRSQDKFDFLINPALFTILAANFLLNSHIYPTLFQYQSGSQVAKFARYEAKIPVDRLYAYPAGESMYFASADFYSERHLAGVIEHPEQLLKIAQKSKIWLYASEKAYKEMKALKVPIKVLKTFDRFHISTLNIKFLNPQRRPSELNKMYLVEFGGK
jgi:4-amino-4-deoxy-L-arabinose transferase-like glycosyltransferase